MSDLKALQAEFARALLSSETPTPSTIRTAVCGPAERRFAVYRNNVTSGLVDALATRFPVTSQLVGDEFFRAMARVYVAREPPRSPIMVLYGETFPAFLESFEPAAKLPYLGAVAALEMARGRAYHAADRTHLDSSAFLALKPERVGATRVKLHPSSSILISRFPIVSIWEAHQGVDEPGPLQSWQPEDALVHRVGHDVALKRLPPGVATFLALIKKGATIAASAEAAGHSTNAFDAAAAFAVLVGSNIAIDLY
jgi:hypothetical protein